MNTACFPGKSTGHQQASLPGMSESSVPGAACPSASDQVTSQVAEGRGDMDSHDLSLKQGFHGAPFPASEGWRGEGDVCGRSGSALGHPPRFQGSRAVTEAGPVWVHTEVRRGGETWHVPTQASGARAPSLKGALCPRQLPQSHPGPLLKMEWETFCLGLKGGCSG